MDPVNDAPLEEIWFSGPFLPKVMTFVAAGLIAGFSWLAVSVISEAGSLSINDIGLAAPLLVVPGLLIFRLGNSAWIRFAVNSERISRRSWLRTKHIPWTDVKTLHIWGYDEERGAALAGSLHGGELGGCLATLMFAAVNRFRSPKRKPEDQLLEALIVGPAGWTVLRISSGYSYKLFQTLRDQATKHGVQVVETEPIERTALF